MLGALFTLNVLDLTYDAKCDVYFVIVTTPIYSQGLFCDVTKVDKLMLVILKYSAK
jgi:hypothetical protein